MSRLEPPVAVVTDRLVTGYSATADSSSGAQQS